MAGFFRHFDATEMVTHKAACEFIVVAGDVDHMAAFAGTAQQLLHHVVVGLRPIPFAAQLPAVDDVAHQIQVIAGVGLQKLNQGLGLASGCAQMQIGDKNGSVMHPVLMGTNVSGSTRESGAPPCRSAASVFNLYD